MDTHTRSEGKKNVKHNNYEKENMKNVSHQLLREKHWVAKIQLEKYGISNVVTPVDENSFYVRSFAKTKKDLQQKKYIVRKIKERSCNSSHSSDTYSCNLHCDSCQMCYHQYSCNCLYASMKRNICKHMHAVCMHLDQTSDIPVLEDEDSVSYENLLKPLEDLYQDLRKTFSEYDSSAAEFYQSRYLDDFEPLESADTGPISAVFEAKNIRDDQEYRIERISLPDEKNVRIKILGMVKVLARNNHKNLDNYIRYNQAWLECPPSGWQEKKYKNWTTKARGDCKSAQPTKADNRNRKVSIILSDELCSGTFYDNLTCKNDFSPSNSNKSTDMVETRTNVEPTVYLYVQLKLINNAKIDSSTFSKLREKLHSDHFKLTSKNLNKSYNSSGYSIYCNSAEIIINEYLENNPIEKIKSYVNALEGKGSQNGDFEPYSSAPEFYRSRYLDDFQQIEKLGSGGFGAVFKCKNKFDDRLYAIKRIMIPEGSVHERDLREVKALAKCRNDNIVRYYQSWLECPPAKLNKKWKLENRCSDDYTSSESTVEDSGISNGCQNLHLSDNESSESSIVFQSSSSKHSAIVNDQQSFDRISVAHNKKSSQSQLYQFIFIQMELCSKIDMKEWFLLKADRRPPLHRLLQIMGQIVAAVRYIHSHGLIHRDLKPSNIFISLNSRHIKIGDLGLVTQTQEDNFVPSRSIGTPLYRSPEQCLGQSYTNKVDVYAMGLIFVELLTSYTTQTEQYFILKNLRQNIFPPNFDDTPEGIVDLIKSMISEKPEERPSAAEIESQITKLKKDLMKKK